MWENLFDYIMIVKLCHRISLITTLWSFFSSEIHVKFDIILYNVILIPLHARWFSVEINRWMSAFSKFFSHTETLISPNLIEMSRNWTCSLNVKLSFCCFWNLFYFIYVFIGIWSWNTLHVGNMTSLSVHSSETKTGKASAKILAMIPVFVWWDWGKNWKASVRMIDWRSLRLVSAYLKTPIVYNHWVRGPSCGPDETLLSLSKIRALFYGNNLNLFLYYFWLAINQSHFWVSMVWIMFVAKHKMLTWIVMMWIKWREIRRTN